MGSAITLSVRFVRKMSQKFFGSDRRDLLFCSAEGKARQVKNNEYAALSREPIPNPIRYDPIRYDAIAGGGGGCGGADADADADVDVAMDVDRSGAECCGSGLVIGAHIGKREHFIFKRFKNTIIIEFAA